MSITSTERKSYSTEDLLGLSNNGREENSVANSTNERPTVAREEVVISSITTSTGHEAIVEKALKTAFESLSQPAYFGLKYINRMDPKTHRFLRYEIPPVSLSDYMNVEPVSGLYAGIGAGIFRYDEPIGCYAIIFLTKKREDSEDCYEELIQEYQCERHALHTDIKGDWFRALYRKTNYGAYIQEYRERRRQQLIGMQKIVEMWEKTNYFLRVYVPSPEERIEKLNQYPEYVACGDEIHLVYKPHPPEEQYATGLPSVVKVPPPMAELQKNQRACYDYLNQSYLNKTIDYVASCIPESRASYRSLRHARNDYSFETTEPTPYHRVSNPASLDQNSTNTSSSGQGDQGSFFFQCWEALVSFFRMIFRYFCGDNQQEE